VTAGAAHLVTRLNVGGIARYLEMARGAVDHLVRGQVEGAEREASWLGPQTRLRALRRSIDPVRDLRALLDLERLLRRLRPTILHTHASKAGALGRIVARRLGIACVHTFHGHVLEGYFPRPLSRLLERAERFLARGVRLTATGPATARDLQARLGVPVAVLPPGIDLPDAPPGAREFLRAQWGRPERVALAVGRPVATKGLARFVRCARRAGFLPVVAGTGRLPGALALGTVRDMAGLYAASDVVVSASTREGTPYALLEAAWYGRPVVALPAGDVAWIVGDGGLVTEDLASGLLRMRDPGLRLELGERAAVEVRRRFPVSGAVSRLRELYADLSRC